MFFVFAIIATACRERFQATITVTACSAGSSLALIITSSRGATQSVYLMRPIYLAIAGYLTSSLGEQRVAFETRVRDLETRSQRLAIARSLHDGFIQSLINDLVKIEVYRMMHLGTAHHQRHLARVNASLHPAAVKAVAPATT